MVETQESQTVENDRFMIAWFNIVLKLTIYTLFICFLMWLFVTYFR